ncbi:hypothetical protein ABB37_07669 [Leptomonas pyrrhocoris]|uniref:Uncharacterized protein n=1 Tax=Leptomonas pyrrhocoris TaxID=157538 RepID=A0A0M9FVM7_LEPPY|nr:hypothetical protein ABB37_07669 [Leptomonas pyrrhocoris]KPA76877.1 hypothetical protein ABB37_07669 [Leptomonas pyrrhocoris]|eukprot:XP_015655316.1 hypothetical protein ABB37_07669 [Leptomonas pyrrhocoris]
MTSPNRDELEAMSDAELLALASENTVFLGEEYTWNGRALEAMHTGRDRAGVSPEQQHTCVPEDEASADPFLARHSAHAEPRAAELMLRHLVEHHHIRDGARIALVTDHKAIVIVAMNTAASSGGSVTTDSACVVPASK